MENKKFYLCYIDDNKVYFTSDWEHQWGDDWDDAPYECNAGEPYDEKYDAEELGIENGRAIYPKRELKTLYVEFPHQYVKTPDCFGSFSVKDINRGVIAWITGDKFVIPAKTEYNDFIRIVKESNGKIFKEVEF